MAKGFKHGAGGVGLNFKVIPNPMPSTAKENTIWVDTDKINNYYFSATQPENMVDYDVWFLIGTSSTVAFSATKKNPIMVFPLSAKQMVSGALVGVTAKSYQGGAWVEWITYLYNNGDECTDITGGWGSVGNCTKTVTKNDDSISATFRGKTSSNTYGCLYTVNKIDLTSAERIVVNGDIIQSSHDGICYLFVSKTLPSSYETNVGDRTAFADLKGSKELDVSALDGEFYVCIGRGYNGQTSYYTTLLLKSCKLIY